jgi:hypothetical protein
MYKNKMKNYILKDKKNLLKHQSNIKYYKIF